MGQVDDQARVALGARPRGAIPSLPAEVPGRGRRLGSAVALAMASPVAVVVPGWVMLSVLIPRVETGFPLEVVVGVAGVLALPAVTAVLWSMLVAAMAEVPRQSMVRGVVRTSLLTVLPVGFGVDMSQVFIDVVWPWHRLAVHTLFGIAFAVGMAILMGRIARRVELVVADADGSRPAGSLTHLERPVALATAVGVVAGAIVSVWLGWEVVPGMGMRMLLPLYLVLATGTSAGGAVLGWWLPHQHAGG